MKKKTKKNNFRYFPQLIAIITTLFVVIGASIGFAEYSGTPKTPEQDSNGVYQIGTAEELYGFAQIAVAGGNTSVSAVLTADIDASGRAWAPIGGNYQFTGTFDGQGHTISGLNCTGGEVGLFYYIGSSGTVKNLGIKNSTFGTVGTWQAGSIAAINNGNITNCYAENCTVTGYYAGGISGINYNTVTYSYNTGAVTCERAGGGISGIIPIIQAQLHVSVPVAVFQVLIITQ